MKADEGWSPEKVRELLEQGARTEPETVGGEDELKALMLKAGWSSANATLHAYLARMLGSTVFVNGRPVRIKSEGDGSA